MALVACGLNANSQITPAGPPLLCCPTPVRDKKDVCEVHIACSHILWKTNAGWQITGYRNLDYSLEEEMAQRWKQISMSEMRMAAINDDGAVVLREKGQWRKLFFQRDTAMDSRNLDGKMYSIGVPLPYGGSRISVVEVGKEHCMALTTDGVVLTWGSGMRGQLGNGELSRTSRESPRHYYLLHSLWGLALSLSTSGDAYMWGWNESGQLGFPAKADQEASILGTFSHRC
nr:ultraviolet-B receptor UVR8-like isoform X5 [Penaeus vannamei]